MPAASAAGVTQGRGRLKLWRAKQGILGPHLLSLVAPRPWGRAVDLAA